MPTPRILLIDSYDSFTFNLASLCRRAIPGCKIHIIKNDALTVQELVPYLHYFSAIIVGPGPGSPDVAEDIGIVKDIWHISEDHLLPIFGVCLGLQSLAIEFGAILKRLQVVKHGQISEIMHGGVEIFKGVGEVLAVRYHSLHVETQGAEDIETLAWADDGDENGRVVMAVKHKSKPFWAVQYHPESVCTDGGGDEVLKNFWRLAKNWSAIRRYTVQAWHASVEGLVGPAWPALPLNPDTSPHLTPHTEVHTRTLVIPGLDLPRLCEALGANEENADFALLESAADPGRFTIIGCLSEYTPRITYALGDPHVHIRTRADCSIEQLHSRDIWQWLASFMSARRAQGGYPDVPFWGGLIGFLSYEVGVASLTTLRPRTPDKRSPHPDVNLVFIERSIVLDRASGRVYVQSLTPNDNDWMDATVALLGKCASNPAASTPPIDACMSKRQGSPPSVVIPDRERYIANILRAKEHLYAGDSYELCLTAPTRVSVPKVLNLGSNSCSTSWDLYKILRSRNSAPHSAYLRLHPSTFVSSSPERFLSYSRPPNSTFQLRPIKGTVRKAPGITRAVAEQLLAGSVKEVAENLMIVDLIRHDLHGVIGDAVDVKQFCKVEEYQTVWQLVSVIEGKPSPEQQRFDLGWEVLRRSLPPGSMTGAPKKRSVEILHDLEDHDRGVYSGVFGYWDVGGGGDWSVTIRTCFKYEARGDANEHCEVCDCATSADATATSNDMWTMGAGGAITALSDPEAEWEEMIVKVESVLRAFEAASA
ncbi:para-aminobenzoic acid synthetase [Gelatoporia subvermispora B]|uniref:aminodeoxychorismate synthase n=1 Tax=Ceriporiopsis subvermispora (strain B) TaxID=914234 RepID=M2QYW8_CERS8|nr:para-aminobenzoic acid synthetase [Gelatoporia subvermispora B]